MDESVKSKARPGAASDREEGGAFQPKFGADGLATCVTIDASRGDVLMVAHMNETALRARGVTHAALFGSRARGDDRPGSDIDIMIEIEPEAVQDVYAYVGLKSYIAEFFAEPVDVVDRAALKPYVRPPAESDAVYAF